MGLNDQVRSRSIPDPVDEQIRGRLRNTYLVPVTQRNRARVRSTLFASGGAGEVTTSRIYNAAFLLFADLDRKIK